MNPVLLTNPSTDSRFRSAAESCLSKGAGSPAELQRCLRAEYPRAAVTDGIVDGGVQRWYVYREGRWVDAAAQVHV